nr:hypothetical protein [Nesterenkonia jeotgali]
MDQRLVDLSSLPERRRTQAGERLTWVIGGHRGQRGAQQLGVCSVAGGQRAVLRGAVAGGRSAVAGSRSTGTFQPLAEHLASRPDVHRPQVLRQFPHGPSAAARHRGLRVGTCQRRLEGALQLGKLRQWQSP